MIITVIFVLFGRHTKELEIVSWETLCRLKILRFYGKSEGLGTLGNERLIRVRINLKAGFNHILASRSYLSESDLVQISVH